MQGDGGSEGGGAESAREELPSLQLVDAEGDEALVLCFDPGEPTPRVRGAARVTVVRDGPREPDLPPDVRVISFRELLRGDAALLRERPRRAIVSTLRSVRASGVAAALRHGARWFHLVDSLTAHYPCNARGALVVALRREAQRRLGRAPLLSWAAARALGRRLDPQFAMLAPTVEATGLALRVSRERPVAAPPATGPLRVVHCIGALGPGGAERQLTYVAERSRAQGHDVSVLATISLEGSDGHYAPVLARAGVPCARLPEHPRWRTTPPLGDLDGRPLPDDLALALEQHVAYEMVVPLVAELRRLRPHVLHCWLDDPNFVGGLVGLAVGVPRIVLSTRNVNPSHFPRFHRPWFAGAYRALAASPRVTLVANSRAGARDYADWLGLPLERFRVVWNGLPLEGVEPLAPDVRRARRAALGLGDDDLLVAGVFRLAAEKRPHDFVAALARARREVPRLRAMHLGVGPDEPALRRQLEAEGLAEAVVLHGRHDDPWGLAGIADVSLLTSGQEGCPNVSLESQARGIPIVLTDAGGSAETVLDGETGFVVPVGDVDALAARLVLLARDPARARAMGRAGRAFIAERFSIDRMVEDTLATYR